MDVYHAIDAAIANPSPQYGDAVTLLSNYSTDVQAQLITAIYLGGSLLHRTTIPQDEDLTRTVIEPEKFAEVVVKRANVIVRYLEKAKECAFNSNFDLRQL
ncbi:hypothetical protein [Paraburkholderia tropica]|uniref:hypothetical protein n=1 Tax=Paraburkholderia tropica TaxID=92647 RepID=UPI0016076616|nr:hypothetical protein [Paraburkholderia tropica]MBB2984462.1 hypothetical protein [Paraburkholderia tropica]